LVAEKVQQEKKGKLLNVCVFVYLSCYLLKKKLNAEMWDLWLKTTACLCML
jgi:hypothetical protein